MSWGSFLAFILAVLLVFTALWIIRNSQIAALANEIGEEYGITDFKSKSAKFNGQVWAIELHSKDFDNLSEEDKFNLMHALSTSYDLQFMMVKDIQQLANPLIAARFTVYSNGRYLISLEEEEDLIWLKCSSKEIYSVAGIEEHGYRLKSGSSNSSSFTNKFGTKNTVCAVDGCSKKIATSGDTNCCVSHSNNCGNCGCFIDGDAMFCMSCLEEALT